MFNSLSEKLSSIFSHLTGQVRLSESLIEQSLGQVRDALLDADIPYEVVTSFLDGVKTEALNQKVISSLKPAEQFVKIVYDKLVHFLGDSPSAVSFHIPSTIMVMGLQGSGKTTTIAKIAHYIREQAASRGKTRSILLASIDFYRPAAIDQLALLADQVGVHFYRAASTDPVKAVQEIMTYYKNQQYELLLLDTAGRLHVDDQMLKELQQIDGIVKPKYKILVLDAMTGQESLSIAQAFEQKIGFSSAILTKMDSQTRAGAAFAFRFTLKKSLLFMGTGEKIADLEPFRSDRIAQRMLGMGDLKSLAEKAAVAIKQHEQVELEKSFKGKMTLQDFSQQLEMVGKIGSLATLMQYLPGGQKISQEMLAHAEVELRKFKAIIHSMTPKERFYPKLLNGSRKQRIAKGSGTTVPEVNLLLARFEQSQQYAKLLKNMGPFGPRF